MSINLHISAESAAELRVAIAALAAEFCTPNVQTAPAPAAPAAVRGPGRPKKTAEPDAPTATPAVPVEAPAAAPPPSAAPAAEAPTLSKGDVQKVLIEVVKQHGAEACGALCRKYGGPNLSSLKVEVWPALLTDAQALLDTEPGNG
jgi:hypothetical protein